MADDCRSLNENAKLKSWGTDSFVRTPYKHGLDKTLLSSRSEEEFEYYVVLFAATTIPEFKRRIDKIVMGLGFSDYAFVRVVSDEVDLLDREFSTSVSERLYIGGLCGHDITYSYDRKCVKPIFKSTVDREIIQTVEMMGDRRLAAKPSGISFESVEYCNISISRGRGAQKEYAILSVAQRSMELSVLQKKVASCQVSLQILCAAIDVVASRKFPSLLEWDDDVTDTNCRVDPKPFWILDVMANNDLTSDQIAEYFSIDVSRVHEILKRIRADFGVRTNFAAIKQAILIGLIDFK